MACVFQDEFLAQGLKPYNFMGQEIWMINQKTRGNNFLLQKLQNTQNNIMHPRATDRPLGSNILKASLNVFHVAIIFTLLLAVVMCFHLH